MFLVKEIRDRNGVLHFKRWALLWTPWFALYLHKICLPDYDEHLHSHPWNFVSLVLKGFYLESSRGQKIHRKPGSLLMRKASDFHQITWLGAPPVWTLVFVWGRRREWGYDVGGVCIDNQTYRTLKHQ